ncbi:MAG TPA: hypothetical protein VGY55_22915 [Pirellulales bacterium]|jgi:hypothetical protein|nr:hypothetical protein [Pirellulales bacterium]
MITHLLAVVIAAGLAVGNSDSPSPQEEQLEKAARAYRIQVYDTFHLDRAEYDRRRAEWTRLEAAWQTAGKPDRELPAIVSWLATATAQSQPESIGPLPDAPIVTADPQTQPKNANARQVVVPKNSDDARAVGGSEPKPEQPTKPSAAEKAPVANVDPATSAPIEQPSSNNAATPVGATTAVEQPAPDEKPAEKETAAPESSAPTPSPPTTGDGADQGRPATTGWLHSLGEELGQDLNSLGVTLAWKRESK